MKRAVLLALLLAQPGMALAGTNFPALSDYPAPSCTKPGDKPAMAHDTPDVARAARNVKRYNEGVAAYNTALAAYTACMNAYVDNAQADMNAIRDKVNQATAAGKEP